MQDCPIPYGDRNPSPAPSDYYSTPERGSPTSGVRPSGESMNSIQTVAARVVFQPGVSVPHVEHSQDRQQSLQMERSYSLIQPSNTTFSSEPSAQGLTPGPSQVVQDR